eukprot:1160304-Pelagomonas_calceolata.AAC.5
MECRMVKPLIRVVQWLHEASSAAAAAAAANTSDVQQMSPKDFFSHTGRMLSRNLLLVLMFCTLCASLQACTPQLPSFKCTPGSQHLLKTVLVKEQEQTLLETEQKQP